VREVVIDPLFVLMPDEDISDSPRDRELSFHWIGSRVPDPCAQKRTDQEYGA
jgi:hypothetical protein